APGGLGPAQTRPRSGRVVAQVSGAERAGAHRVVRGRGVARRQAPAALALTVLAALTGCGSGDGGSPAATVSDAGRDTTIMIIRHGEKPGHGEQGVDEAGKPGKKSLTRR